MVDPGFTLFDFDPRVAAWAEAAHRVAATLDLRPDRCGGTWHVGVDALPNAADGSIDGVPLEGPWDVSAPVWHRAQISVVYPGFPAQDAGESEAAHRYRVTRFGAHLDGLLPEGPQKRRHLREPHAFILGLPLDDVEAAPLMVWPGSHAIMGRAFAVAFEGVPAQRWGDVDVTEIYQSARREVFDSCAPEAVVMRPGQAVLLHRQLIHGLRPWGDAAGQRRMVAYFRPILPDVSDWL